MAGFQGVTAPGSRYDTVPGIPWTQGAKRKLCRTQGARRTIYKGFLGSRDLGGQCIAQNMSLSEFTNSTEVNSGGVMQEQLGLL